MPLNKRREPLRLADVDRDTPLRLAAFEHVRRLGETHDHLTATELKPGFAFEGERFPLMNPQRGIFKPQQMRFLLSIKTVFPRPGTRVWYDDQREVHRQIFEADETIDYAFMGQDPGAADNRWLREAFEHLSVSNSSSGRRWKLDHAPAAGDPTHMVEFGTGRRAFAREA